MNTKLQELTDKIYQEGVEKGNTEAQQIIEKAQARANEIVADAKSQAEKIISDAQKNSVELNKNTQSELRLFAQQFINSIKTEIADLINGEIVSDSVKAATTDKDFMQKVTLAFVQGWDKNDQLTIETKDAEALNAYFASNAKDLLSRGLTVKETDNMKTGFAITSENKGYKITFGEEELIEYFKEFLRPKLVEMLFDASPNPSKGGTF